jgi:hypothetical protein
VRPLLRAINRYRTAQGCTTSREIRACDDDVVRICSNRAAVGSDLWVNKPAVVVEQAIVNFADGFDSDGQRIEQRASMPGQEPQCTSVPPRVIPELRGPKLGMAL